MKTDFLSNQDWDNKIAASVIFHGQYIDKFDQKNRMQLAMCYVKILASENDFEYWDSKIRDYFIEKALNELSSDEGAFIYFIQEAIKSNLASDSIIEIMEKKGFSEIWEKLQT